MRYLILVALVIALLWRLLQVRVSRSGMKPQTAREPERMVACAYCGVNQPLSECVRVADRYYCCAAHRQSVEDAGVRR